MSYDIRFAVKVAGAPDDCFAVIGEPEYCSPTYNIGKMMRVAMDWDFKQGTFYKLTDVLPKIRQGLAELISHPEQYKQYEPDNGWGTVDSAAKALSSILDWASPDNCWDRGWNGDIPMDAIWIAW